MDLFVVTMVNGSEYDRSRPRREQRGWDEHAVFMDGLLDEGFVVLGGPIGDGERVMLVVEAADEEESAGGWARIHGRRWAYSRSARSSSGRSGSTAGPGPPPRPMPPPADAADPAPG